MDEEERDEALRREILRRMRSRGLTAGTLAEKLEMPGRRDRFYKALRGVNRITNPTLRLFAEGLDTSVDDLEVSAGVLSESEVRRLRSTPRARDAIQKDRRLNDRQRRILLGLYDEFVDADW